MIRKRDFNNAAKNKPEDKSEDKPEVIGQASTMAYVRARQLMRSMGLLAYSLIIGVEAKHRRL